MVKWPQSDHAYTKARGLANQGTLLLECWSTRSFQPEWAFRYASRF
jgi:hypothetical protein